MKTIKIKQGVNLIDLTDKFDPLAIFKRYETRKRIQARMKEALKPTVEDQQRAKQIAQRLMLELASRYERE